MATPLKKMTSYHLNHNGHGGFPIPNILVLSAFLHYEIVQKLTMDQSTEKKRKLDTHPKWSLTSPLPRHGNTKEEKAEKILELQDGSSGVKQHLLDMPCPFIKSQQLQELR